MEHLPTYVIDWKLSEAERGIESFTTFMRGAGAKFEPSPDLNKLLAVYREAPERHHESRRELFEEMLVGAGEKALKAAGDERRLFREVGEVRRWRLLTPEQLVAAKANGLQLVASGAPARRAMWTFATIPVAIGTYVFATRWLRAEGVDDFIAWPIAIAAYALVRFTLNQTLLRAR